MTDKDSEGNQPVRAPFGPTSRSLPIALLRARESVMGPVRVMLQESNISEQQWRVLRVIDEQGEIEQTTIANAACLQLPSLTRILRNMESEGLVIRRTDRNDRRKSMVSITDSGRELIANHAARNAEIFGRLEGLYGREKLDLLLDLLEDLRLLKL
ncbi:MAG: homoprotocatechuate degradation operon regulator HpaR [Nitratireductor sp.]